jgi:hypothetical protein
MSGRKKVGGHVKYVGQTGCENIKQIKETGRCALCEFISWIELDGHEYFLTNADLETKAGKKLLLSDVKDDLCGHGAILSYYPELNGKGLKKECEDFSSQKNFPKSIAKAIKNGELSRIGICLDVLTETAWAEYNKIKETALAEYNKIKEPAWLNTTRSRKRRLPTLSSRKRTGINIGSKAHKLHSKAAIGTYP